MGRRAACTRATSHARRLSRAGAVHRQGRGPALPQRSRRSLRRAAVRRSGAADGRSARRRVPPATRRSSPSSGAGAGSRRRRSSRAIFWGWGVRPGDFVMLVLFTFRGPTYGLFQHSLGDDARSSSTSTREMERFCELSIEYRPTAVYNFGSVADQRGEGRGDRRGFDPRDVFSSYRGVTFAGEPLSPAGAALAESWGIELFEHGSVGDVTGVVRMRRSTTACTRGKTPCSSRASTRRRRTGGRWRARASSSPPRWPTASRRSCGSAPTTSCGSPTTLACAGAPTCACGRSAARATRSSSTEFRCCRSTCGERSRASTRARSGLFQVIRAARRGRPAAAARRATRRTWSHRLDTVRDELMAAVLTAMGVEPDVELVPNDALLRLGPPHKIPRVARS